MQKNQKLEMIIYVGWEEYEQDWGARPDGCSIHLTKEDYKKFSEHYWSKMPKEEPNEYSRPAGDPVTALAARDLYKGIQKSRFGLRLSEDQKTELLDRGKLVYGNERSGWVTIYRR